jgi:Icc-related predicted phosphoesterase
MYGHFGDTLRHRRHLKTERRRRALRIYYASDVHGSELCWKKFLNAARHYEAGVLIMGGDLTGKAMVPIVRSNGTAVAEVVGERRTARSEDERAALEAAIRANGFYPLEIDPEQHAAMRGDADLRESLFARAMLDELRRWVELAEQRLGGTDVRVFVMPGNDDPWAIDDLVKQIRGMSGGTRYYVPRTK